MAFMKLSHLFENYVGSEIVRDYGCTLELNTYSTIHRRQAWEFLLTSGDIGHLPISSHINAYSKLVRPLPYLTVLSVSRGTNKFHNPSDLALACMKHSIDN